MPDRILSQSHTINLFTFLAVAVHLAISENGNGKLHRIWSTMQLYHQLNYFSVFNRFDTERSTWDYLPSLTVTLFNYLAIEMDGNFYVAGEYKPKRNVDHPLTLKVSIWCFDLANRFWTEMTSFDGPSITSMAKLESKISSERSKLYFIFSDSSLKSYDPIDNSWKHVIHLF